MRTSSQHRPANRMAGPAVLRQFRRSALALGVVAGAIAAARRAVMLEPDNWRHHLRVAFVSWGEQRLGSAPTISPLEWVRRW